MFFARTAGRLGRERFSSKTFVRVSRAVVDIAFRNVGKYSNIEFLRSRLRISMRRFRETGIKEKFLYSNKAPALYRVPDKIKRLVTPIKLLIILFWKILRAPVFIV